MLGEPSCAVHVALHDFFKKYPDIELSKSLAVAVSGGPDSMALAHALLQLYAGRIHMICVNHGLRQSVEKEIDTLSEWVKSLDNDHVSLKILNWNNNAPDSALMEKARQARYDLMADYCSQNAIENLFVAHHQDDQAETFLIRLIAGSGLDGLAAMEEKHSYTDIEILRPLLGCSKQTLMDYCGNYNVPFSSDPSNENDAFLRPRLRKNFPALTAEGLSNKRLATSSKRLRRARNALELLTDAAFDDMVLEQKQDVIHLDYVPFTKQPEEIAFRLVQKSIEHFRKTQSYHVRMEKVEDLFNDLWLSQAAFKPRTLGGVKIALGSKTERIIFEKQR